MKISLRTGKLLFSADNDGKKRKRKARAKKKSRAKERVQERDNLTIKEAMQSFPLKDDVHPSYASKADTEDVTEFRVSRADVFNADSYLYLMIAQSVHVYEKLNTGIPHLWDDEEGSVEEYVMKHFGMTREEVGLRDPVFELRVEKYHQMLTELRDEFVWLYQNDSSTAPYDETMYADGELDMYSWKERKKARKKGVKLPLFRASNEVMQAKREERDREHREQYERRKTEAFQKLSEEVDGMWL